MIIIFDDSIKNEVLDYLQGLAAEGNFIKLEFGLESTKNETLEAINRCQTHEQAIEEVKKKNLEMITWARHILANPDFVSKLKNGEKMLEMTDEMRKNLQ